MDEKERERERERKTLFRMAGWDLVGGREGRRRRRRGEEEEKKIKRK